MSEPGSYGIDRVSVAFPVRNWERDPEAWGVGINERPGPAGTKSYGALVPLSGSGVGTLGRPGEAPGPAAFVGVMEIRSTGRPWGKIEFNPSRWVDPDGVSLCSVGDLRPSIERAAAVASELLDAAVPVDDMRVRRVDVARDFALVEDAGFYVRGLLNVRRPWARTACVNNDPAKGGAESLRVGSGAGLVRLYDKFEESPGKAAPGALRWEAECRRGWSERYGAIATVSDLNADRIGSLARDRWEWSSMGVEVAATDRVLEKIERAGHRPDCRRGCELHLSPAEQRGFYGYLVFTARGRPSPMSKSTGAKYARISKELNITLSGLDASAQEDTVTGRLDWETGREVLRVA